MVDRVAERLGDPAGDSVSLPVVVSSELFSQLR
jgi:hypothetical protein